MIKEVLPDIFRIQVPLPENPLKSLNSYLVKGNERSLLIDTGFNRKECLDAMLSAIKELRVSMTDVDIFVTHLHTDHCGLVSSIIEENSKAYMSRIDSAVLYGLYTDRYWEEMRKEYCMYGFPEDELNLAIGKNPARVYLPSGDIRFNEVEDGDNIQVGRFTLTCVWTPGHTPGHMCLYEKKTKTLISGDHVLSEISPNISKWRGMEDPLGDYLKSLEKVAGMDIDFALPRTEE